MATATKKKESDYLPVFKLLRGLRPGYEVQVQNERNTDPDEELNRIAMAVRRGPIMPRKGFKWRFRKAEKGSRSVVYIEKIA